MNKKETNYFQILKKIIIGMMILYEDLKNIVWYDDL